MWPVRAGAPYELLCFGNGRVWFRTVMALVGLGIYYPKKTASALSRGREVSNGVRTIYAVWHPDNKRALRAVPETFG
jgi:hypothetical protein